MLRHDGVVPLIPGIDLVAADEVREALEMHGEQYLRRVFTPREIEDCGGVERPDPAALAERFAAKEAAVKVLRPDGEAIPMTDVEVHTTPLGRVELVLNGAAAALAKDRQLGPLSITISREGNLAAAVAVAGPEQP